MVIHSVSRRDFLRAGAGLAAASVVVGVGRTADAEGRSQPPQTIDLGVPMRTSNVRYALSDYFPDGTPVNYGICDGTPVSFNVTNALTGERIDAFEIDDASIGATIAVAPDKATVYFAVRTGKFSQLSKYVPADHSMTPLLRNPVGEVVLRSLAVADDGMVYGSTYPHAKVFSLNPQTGELRDYGSMTTDGAYAWGLALIDGKIWVGTGIGTAHLFVLDPATGDKEEMPLPAPFAGAATYIYKISQRGRLALVVLAGASGVNTAFYDLDAGAWAEGTPIDAVISLNGSTTDVDASGAFYYYTGGELFRFDTHSHQSSSTGWTQAVSPVDADGLRDIGLLTIDGTDIVDGIRDNGTHIMFDVSASTAQVIRDDIDGAPATVHRLGIGPDQKIYAGAYLSSGVMARIDPRTDTIEQLSGPEQAEGMAAHDGKFCVGVYPSAKIFAGDVREDWNWGVNPSQLFSIGRGGAYDQDRPLAMVSAGDKVALGTVPNYGELGGALTLFDLRGNFEFHRNVVPDQSVVALAYHAGLLVGGTCIRGGLSSIPTQTTARLFGWDMDADRLVFSVAPVPGSQTLSSLTFTRTGELWGLTNEGVIFEFEVKTQTVIRTFDTGRPTGASPWGSNNTLIYRSQDHRLYGVAAGQVFSFDPTAETYTVISDVTARPMAINARGDIYFADDTHVYRHIPATA